MYTWSLLFHFYRYGISDQGVAIGNVICTGVESHLLRCQYDLKPNCYPYQNIGIMCCELNIHVVVLNYSPCQHL